MENAPDSQAKRTRLSPEARRSQLLDIGYGLLLTEPLENVTVDRVADMAGVSRGLVFHYFPTVRDLHLACLGTAADDLAQKVAIVNPADPGEVRVRRSLTAFVDYIGARRQTFLTMSSYAATDAGFGEIFERFRLGIVDLMCQQSGLPDNHPMSILMLRSWVAYAEVAILQWLNNPTIERHELIDMLVSVKSDVEQTWRSRYGNQP